MKTGAPAGMVALCLIVSLAGAGLLLALVWFLLRPLAALDESAWRVAGGRYDERLAVRGRDMNAMAAAVQQRVEYARVISEEAKRLRSLSGKLLELITLGSASLEPAPASLREIAEEVELSLRPVMAQSELRLECNCLDLMLDMDRELFKSLLYNLLDNGRKASRQGDCISITAWEAEGQAEIFVRDYREM